MIQPQPISSIPLDPAPPAQRTNRDQNLPQQAFYGESVWKTPKTLQHKAFGWPRNPKAQTMIQPSSKLSPFENPLVPTLSVRRD